jgi:hypothetical protein
MTQLEPKMSQLFLGDVKCLISCIKAIGYEGVVVFSEINVGKHLGETPNAHSWLYNIMLVHRIESSRCLVILVATRMYNVTHLIVTSFISFDIKATGLAAYAWCFRAW